MDVEFTKQLKSSEVRWGFIHVHYTKKELFPDSSFALVYKDQHFNVNINKVNRIVCKRLLRMMGARTGTTISIKKESDSVYSISIID